MVIEEMELANFHINYILKDGVACLSNKEKMNQKRLNERYCFSSNQKDYQTSDAARHREAVRAKLKLYLTNFQDKELLELMKKELLRCWKNV